MTTSTLLLILLLGAAFFAFLLYLTYLTADDKKKWREELILSRGVNKDNLNSKTSSKKDAKNKEDLSKKLKNKSTSSEIDEELSDKSIQYLLIQAGSEIPVAQYWFYAAISAAIFFGLSLSFLSGNFLAIILLTITGFFGFPYFILNQKVKRRQNKILTELPDCLDGMVRLLKSGMPVSEAIAMTARQNKGPIGEEMSKIYEAQRIGDTVPEAVTKFAYRVPLPEIKMFATAITIQAKTGASLSEILVNLSNVIRERFKLKRKVKALSSEAKASAGIIGSLPIVMVSVVYLVSPDYIVLLWTTDLGMNIIYGSAFWMCIGIFVMKQMISFKI